MFLARLLQAGSPRVVLVRVGDEPSSTDGLAQLRDDVSLLRRVRHEHVLSAEHATIVKERLAVVYALFKGANLAVCLESNVGGDLPLRAALEISAAVAIGLDAATAVEALQPERRLFHAGPSPADVLIDAVGRVKVVGCRVHASGRETPARDVGYAAPEEAVQNAALAFGVATLLLEMVCDERPGELSPEELEGVLERVRGDVVVVAEQDVAAQLLELLRKTLSTDLSRRPSLRLLAERLDALANEVNTRGLRSWASSCVPRVSRKLNTEELPAVDDPTEDALVSTVPRSASRPLPEEDTRAAAVPGSGDDPFAEANTFRTPDEDEGALPLVPQEPADRLEMPLTELIQRPPAHAQDEDWTEPRPTERISPQASAESTVPRATDVSSDVFTGSTTADLGQGASERATIAEMGFVAEPVAGVDFDAATIADIAPDGPSVLPSVSMSLDQGGPSLPSRFEIDTSTEAFRRERQRERTDSLSSRPLWPVVAAIVVALIVGVWWLQGDAEELGSPDESTVEVPFDAETLAPVDADLPKAEEPEAEPTTPAAVQSAPAAPRSSPPSSKARQPQAPVAAPAAQVSDGGASGESSPTSASVSATPSTTPSTPAESVDDASTLPGADAELAGPSEPSRSTTASAAPEASSEEESSASVWDDVQENSDERATQGDPVAPVEASPQPTETPTSGASGFRVEFVSANPDITEIEARCHVGSGADPQRVVLENADTGPCRVKGTLKSGRPLITAVVIKDSATFICFANGVASCR